MAAAKAAGVEALLVTHLPDVRWLCGFTGRMLRWCCIGGAGGAVYRRPLYRAGQGRGGGDTGGDCRRSRRDRGCEWMEAGGRHGGAVSTRQYDRGGAGEMRKAVSRKVRRGMFVAVGSLVARLREVKDADEIWTIRAAALLGLQAVRGSSEYHAGGDDGDAVAAELEFAARLAGAEGCRLRRSWRVECERRCRMGGQRGRSCRSEDS